MKEKEELENITILVRNPVQSTFISCIANAIARTVFIFMSTAPNEVKNRQNIKLDLLILFSSSSKMLR